MKLMDGINETRPNFTLQNKQFIAILGTPIKLLSRLTGVPFDWPKFNSIFKNLVKGK
jgi:hypothetical protein